MSLAEMIRQINTCRSLVGQPAVELNSRPSSSGTGTTLELLSADGTVLVKTTHGGGMVWFLKGMLTAFQNAPAPQVANFDNEFKAYRRMIDLG
jgi:hypothetical protein